ncbi:MAG: right-handed parallel beta-helix repeat-containing protein [Lentisphaerae bacterium]|nr:right-handed parallel beta-helix repeat-containing protein [Lentisphaerota bacterium]
MAAVLALCANVSQAQVYVDASVAGGAGDGSTWANAYASLASALSMATKYTEIWVARGTYKPGATGTDRATSFAIVESYVSVYGGFTNGMTQRDERNGTLNPTILSGDYAGNDSPDWGNREDNAYGIFRIYSDTILPTGDVLDGFIVRGGNGDAGDGSPNSYGGGVSVYNSAALRIANCVFIDNSADGSGGLYLRRSTGAVVENCIFSGNRATAADHNFGSGGAGLAAQAGAYSVDFRNCRFAGNFSSTYGGAFYSTHMPFTNTFVNCLFVGNQSAENGGGVYIRNLPNPMVNCTFSLNNPNAVGVGGTTTVATNVILWSDTDEIGGFGHLQYAYSDVMGSAGAGISNLDVNPLFALTENGNWTANAVYDPAAGQTLLTDVSAQWPSGRLTGGTVNPDGGQFLEFYIATNTATTLLVWGDASAGGSGDAYALHDWHLQTNSPCVDAGDPGFDWSIEPDYPSGRIDMGAYGNTVEAATTNPPPPFVLDLPPGLKLFIR